MPTIRFPGKQPDTPKATQLSPHAQALLDEQRRQNSDSPFVQSLMPTEQMTGSSMALPLKRSDPYVFESQPSELADEHDLQRFYETVKMGHSKAAHGTGDFDRLSLDLEWSKHWRQAIQETSNEIKKEKGTTSFSTRYRIRYQPENKMDPASLKKTSTHFAPVAKRPVGSSANYGTISPTVPSCELDDEADSSGGVESRIRPRVVRRPVGGAPVPSSLHKNDAKPSNHHVPVSRKTPSNRVVKAQKHSGLRADDPGPSYVYGPTFGRRLLRRLARVQEQWRFTNDEPELASSVGYITSDLLSRDPHHAQEQLSFPDDETQSTFSAGTMDTALSPLIPAELPALQIDSPEPTFSVGPASSPLEAQEQLSFADDDCRSNFIPGTPYMTAELPALQDDSPKHFGIRPASSALEAQEQTSLSDGELAPSSSAASNTSTIFSSSPLPAAELPANVDASPSPIPISPTKPPFDPLPPRQSASFLVSTLTPAAFLPKIYPTDTIRFVKLGRRVVPRVVPLNLTAEARARVDAGTPFIEGLLTRNRELNAKALEGLAMIEGVLGDEVAKILQAESLADLRRCGDGSGSVAELEGGEVKVGDGDEGAVDGKGDGGVEGFDEKEDLLMAGEEEHGEQEWEMVDDEMEDVQGWTVL